jgi:hypothetical protein
LSRGNENARAILERWTRAGFETVLPCPVLAETLRGKPSDAAVCRIVNSRSAAIAVLPVFEHLPLATPERESDKRPESTSLSTR